MVGKTIAAGNQRVKKAEGAAFPKKWRERREISEGDRERGGGEHEVLNEGGNLYQPARGEAKPRKKSPNGFGQT